MTESSETLTTPLLLALLALMFYAVARILAGTFVLIRDGLADWRGKQELEALKLEVDRGRASPFELFMQHGQHALRIHDAVRARAFFEAAATAHPLSPQAFYGQALAWRQSLHFAGHLQERALSTVLEREPDNDDARLLLIEFYGRVGLPEKARAEYDRLVQPKPDPGVDDDDSTAWRETRTWSRMGGRDVFCLVMLDAVLGALVVASFRVPTLALVTLWLAALVAPYHLLFGWRLSTDEDGITVRATWTEKRIDWKDVTDMLASSDGRGFFLVTRDGPLFVSREWRQYDDLETTVRRHLYMRGWTPLLREYGHLRRPLLA